MRGTGLLHNTDIIGVSDTVTTVALTSGTGQAFDTPTGARYGMFTFNVDIWVAYGSTGATSPAASSTVGSTKLELNPTIRNIGSTLDCTGVSVYSDLTGKGVIVWYN
jgi:hypothetical protein